MNPFAEFLARFVTLTAEEQQYAAGFTADKATGKGKQFMPEATGAATCFL